MMAEDEKEPKGYDYGKMEEPLSKEELEYARLLTEQKAIKAKRAYEASPQYKVRKYVTPMRSFTKDVLGFVKKIPRYEAQAKEEYGKLKSQYKGAIEEEKKIERDIAQALGGEVTKEKPKDDWSLGFDKPPTEKAIPKKPAKKGEDWSGLDLKDMKF
jgi:hypothetical protein